MQFSEPNLSAAARDSGILNMMENLRLSLDGIPVHVLVLMFLCCYALSRRRWEFFLPALPLLLSVGIILLAPGIAGMPRYAYPVVYSLPVVMAYYYSLVKKE